MTADVSRSKSLLFLATATILLSYISVYFLQNTTSKNSVLSVTTSCGVVLGKVSTTPQNTEIFEFYNIPYAIPPVGQLRFHPPQLYNKEHPWNSTINSAEQGKILCPQPSLVDGSVIGTEDCLYLTVRTTNLEHSRTVNPAEKDPVNPLKPVNPVKPLKPVIVWIHGGRFIHGYCCRPGYGFDNDLTETLDAVTVNINYR